MSVECESCLHEIESCECVAVEPARPAPRTVEAVAADVIQSALAWAPDARLIGNVTARELATMAARLIDTCPRCGACAWVNIDCVMCNVFAEVRDG